MVGCFLGVRALLTAKILSRRLGGLPDDRMDRMMDEWMDGMMDDWMDRMMDDLDRMMND